MVYKCTSRISPEMKSIFFRGFLLSLILGGSSPALAEESPFFNGKHRISNPYIDRHSRASIDALHDGYFDMRSVDRGDFNSVDVGNLWQNISRINLEVDDYMHSFREIILEQKSPKIIVDLDQLPL